MVSTTDFRFDGRKISQRVGRSKLGWSLHYCVVSVFDKKLCSTLSLFTQGPVVRKPINANPRLKVNRSFLFAR